jgi:transposase
MNKARVKGCFVGIDVSKDTLDVFVRPGAQSWTQPSSDVEGLCERLKPLDPTLIVLEPTGGYEVHVLNALIRGGFRVSREHAFRIHHHAKGSGQLAKTDRLDAGMIAHYAQCYAQETEPMTEPLEGQELLQQLSLRRRQLVGMRAAEKNRVALPSISEILRASCEKIIEVLSQEIEEVEERIEGIIRGNERWKEKQVVLESMGGIGSLDLGCQRCCWLICRSLAELIVSR